MKYINSYMEWVIITAVPLYILHLFYPYSYREGFPYDDPPPKFLGSFSLGQLVQFIIQIFTLPLILFAALPLQFLGKAAEVVLMILVLIWGFGPRVLSRKIDGW